MTLRIFLIVTLLLSTGFLFPSQAQQSGNVVEYFGKDHVNSIAEGVVIQQFDEAFLLEGAIRQGLLTGSEDIISWLIASDAFIVPTQNLKVVASWSDRNDTLCWKQIKADSNAIFQGIPSRSYVYASYNSPTEQVVLLDASGHTRVFVNGLMHEGDHYDYGYTLIPVRLNQGLNQFLFSSGRFPRLKARLVEPAHITQITPRDPTLPALNHQIKEPQWAAVKVVNSSESALHSYSVRCQLETGESLITEMDEVIPMTIRKIKFLVPAQTELTLNESVEMVVSILDQSKSVVHELAFELKVQDSRKHHERTFLSRIDGRVQYFSVAPPLTLGPGQGLVLSLHGASVEATNQSRAYKQKDNAWIVAPTNRRPYGFNWEEWGRMDALEVLNLAKEIFQTDPQKQYLTGHSMGGHGSWVLGTTYPDLFAAVAPAAAYPDIITYRRDGSDSALFRRKHFNMIYRSASSGRILNLKQNLAQTGVYILHGSADQVVPVEKARTMRAELGTFHPNFTYFEYPDGTHWYGDHSMDWPPLFDFLFQNSLPEPQQIKRFSFLTASTAVSSSNHWLRIINQTKQGLISQADVSLNSDSLKVDVTNTETFSLNLQGFKLKSQPKLVVNKQLVDYKIPSDSLILIQRINNNAYQIAAVGLEKKPERGGGFKFAFDHQVVLVYATGGSVIENLLYLQKARFDAETFLYRGNGSFEIIPDSLYSLSAFKDRNVVLYGNSSNNLAWNILLESCPVQVSNDLIAFGDQHFKGDDLGSFFVYPLPGTAIHSVGVVSATGLAGIKALNPNDYFSGITGFPDLLIFRTAWLKDGLAGMLVSGFFGNDWSIASGDFEVTEMDE